MPGKVIGLELPFGYPGNYARTPDCIIMNRKVKTNPIAFGGAAVLNTDNTYSPFGGSNTAAQFAGIAVREVKQATSYASQNEVGYAVGDPCDVIERGNVVVKCQRGTPTAGGAVYIRITENASYEDCVVGGLEAAADGTGTAQDPALCLQLTNCYWTTGKMASDGSVEMTIKYKA